MSVRHTPAPAGAASGQSTAAACRSALSTNCLRPPRRYPLLLPPAPRPAGTGWLQPVPVHNRHVPLRWPSWTPVRQHTPAHAEKRQSPGGLTVAELEKQSALKAELFDLLGDGSSGTNRMARAQDTRKRLETVVEELCLLNPTQSTVDSPLLLGRWQLLTTFKPGTADVSFFSSESWRKYIFEQGPSPVQSLVLGNTASVSGVSQLLEDPRADGSKWQNVVAFGEGNQLVIEAVLEGVRDEKSFYYRFSGGFFKLKGGTCIPYPVPFDVLESLRPGQTKGWFSTEYLDKDLRISAGNKGSVFVLRRPPGKNSAPSEPLIK